MEKYMTAKQKEVLFKKQRIFELGNLGYTHQQVWVKLNEELKELNIKPVSISYIYKYWNEMKREYGIS
ncbi:peptide ABC transporter substrate-binding protein [Bacillus cereus]|uniref:peptide ABC transporter substrate-binding protein n=1 Tax=Bacillus cereus TaxID=1396 RepID=UPI0022E83E2A|nr:peptide ABC transporter substrate-binding protein [Bacillus cereus]MDZ4430952.1 peptide ABC transporter substrate-binding protein [Bacillus cereus]MDZ4645211.1 peptide ABC transporter substrate-binding protein [Bacillus cereus]